MKRRIPFAFPLAYLLLIPLLLSTSCTNRTKGKQEGLRLNLQTRHTPESVKGEDEITQEQVHWDPTQTAIVVCDMWDRHWCQGATSRVAAMVPSMNEMLKAARAKGIFIVHAPSDVVDFYEGSPQRQYAKGHDAQEAASIISQEKLAIEKNLPWPIDDSDGGCDCDPTCAMTYPWTRQHAGIEIMEGDAISDSGAEIYGMFREKGIRHVILTGVHTNMCILQRSFGLRNMIRLGMDAALMRDLTDAMYNSRMEPHVSHSEGTQLVIRYIESYICPTVSSSDITGKEPFSFEGAEL